MSKPASTIWEQQAASAFDHQSKTFDMLYGTDTIINYKRKRVRSHVMNVLVPGSFILELNAGTGEDAVYFASKGYRVHATDIAAGMQEKLKAKVDHHQLQQLVTSESCSFTELENLSNQGPYDHIFSNFAGLNCTGDLPKVLDAFNHLLKPGGTVTLVMLPPFCAWETLLLLKGKFKTAFRRFSGKKGSAAKIDDHQFRCWYYRPSFIRRYLKATFDMVALEGLCTLVPPSYMEGFPEKHPRLYRFLERKENKWKSSWPWRAAGDYFIITLRKK